MLRKYYWAYHGSDIMIQEVKGTDESEAMFWICYGHYGWSLLLPERIELKLLRPKAIRNRPREHEAWCRRKLVEPEANKESGVEIFLQDHHFSSLVKYFLLFLIDIVMLFYFQESYLSVVIIGGDKVCALKQLVIEEAGNSTLKIFL